MTSGGVYSKAAMIEGLRGLGLTRGDWVLMHSDLRSLALPREVLAAGEFGGMDWLIEAFREVLGPTGLLAVPTFTKAFKPGQPGPTGEVWHPDKTPSRVGQITNHLLAQPDRKRSDHPTHPVAAIGKDAAAFCRGHSWREGASTFDRNGPWGHLVDADGYILWLGTDMRTQTCVHVVEDWMRLPYMETAIALVEVDGRVQEVTVTQSPAGPRDFYKKDSKAARAWEAAGLTRKGTVCRAACQLMKAQVFVDWLWKALLADPCLLLNDGATDEFTVRAVRETPKHLHGFKGTWRR
jgi:aminoglycoside 3-N-acetyltransferase